MKLNKEYGQVFLKESSFLKKAAYALPLDGQTVVEIGSGSGRLTEFLVTRAKKLICIELDPRMCALLNDKFKSAKNIEIINQDVIKFSLSYFSEPVMVIGNVPYQISSELIKWVIAQRHKIIQAGFTLQKEVVQKIIAQPGDNQYGFISCQTQFFAETEQMFSIPAGAFSPIPQVDSAFVKMKFYSQPPYAVNDQNEFIAMLRQAFNARRKKIINALSFLMNKEIQLLELGIDPNLRPEKISLFQFAQIFKLRA